VLFSALYSWHVLCQCYSSVATVLSDVKCTSEWDHHNNTFAFNDTRHSNASTLIECQAACEFDPHCVAVDWNWYDRTCDLNTETDHIHRHHYWYDWDTHWNHYDLVSRCNITFG